MKAPGKIARDLPCLLLAVSLTSMASLVAQPVALAGPGQVNSSSIFTGDLHSAHSYHTATPLRNGDVLVAGGYNRNDVLNTTELYDPSTGHWRLSASLTQSRVGHTATLLPNCKVLVVGGNSSTVPPSFGVTRSTELYDTDTGTTSNTGNLHLNRAWHTANLLQNGKVLVTGGWDGAAALKSTEIYDPDTGIWNSTGDLNVARCDHTATLLEDGKVLAVAGTQDGDLYSTLASAELYDPETGTWSAIPDLDEPRVFHTATLLANGGVLVAGGYGGYIYGQSDSSELYDQATGKWSRTGDFNTFRYGHTATLLPDGKVLVCGGGAAGQGGPVELLSSVELYDPGNEIWVSGADLNTPRIDHTATLLAGGQVLIAGGGNSVSVELYDPASGFGMPPKISSAAVAGKRLFIVGENFDHGARILLNGEEQKTLNDDQNPKTALIGKKAGKKIRPGDKLRVRNPNGALSEEFTFPGS